MKKYMLDTNTVSHFIRQNPTVIERVLSVPILSILISVVTEAELMFGLAKRPNAKKLRVAVQEFLRCVEVLPWESSTAEYYGRIRASMENQGKSLSPFDFMIAAHAAEVSAILVTNDSAFSQVENLNIEDWTKIT